MTLVNSSHLSLVSTSSLRDRSPRSSLVPRPPTPGMLKAHLGWLWVQDKELQSLDRHLPKGRWRVMGRGGGGEEAGVCANGVCHFSAKLDCPREVISGLKKR